MSDDILDVIGRRCAVCKCLPLDPWRCDLCIVPNQDVYCVHCYMAHLNADHQTTLMLWETAARAEYHRIHGSYPEWTSHDVIDGFLEQDGQDPEEFGRRSAVADDRQAWG